MEARQTTLTELEERLAGAGGDALRLRLVRDLQGLEMRLAGRLGGMVPRDEFAPLTASIEAVSVAQKVLRDWVPGTAQISGRSP